VAKKLLLLVLAAAAAAWALSSRGRVHIGDPSGNGGPSYRSEGLRRLVGEARERLRASDHAVG